MNVAPFIKTSNSINTLKSNKRKAFRYCICLIKRVESVVLFFLFSMACASAALDFPHLSVKKNTTSQIVFVENKGSIRSLWVRTSVNEENWPEYIYTVIDVEQHDSNQIRTINAAVVKVGSANINSTELISENVPDFTHTDGTASYPRLSIQTKKGTSLIVSALIFDEPVYIEGSSSLNLLGSVYSIPFTLCCWEQKSLDNLDKKTVKQIFIDCFVEINI